MSLLTYHQEEAVQELLDLIRTHVEPDSWREEGGTIATVSEVDEMLVVKQTGAAHEKVRALLAALREVRDTRGNPLGRPAGVRAEGFAY